MANTRLVHCAWAKLIRTASASLVGAAQVCLKMSWIPVPPLSTSDTNNAPTPSYPFPSPAAAFGSSPPATSHQPHWLLPYGPREEIFPEDIKPHLQPILNKCQNDIFIGEYFTKQNLVGLS